MIGMARAGGRAPVICRCSARFLPGTSWKTR
ncbi:MAG: hypothetical protein AW07_00346 [Candidatus Accumulibacter sp. SK-11]|nr:MAG: hypothetical protein AW07_00346 [Candidatus Accumulibacter sp. SK-11]